MRREEHQAIRRIRVRLPFTVVTAITLFLSIGLAESSRAEAMIGSQHEDAFQKQTAAESDLRTGIQLTQNGRFEDAIPHLLAAQGHVADEYAASFDLALCYVGIGKFKDAVGVLSSLKDEGHATAAVNNLLAQAWIGAGQPQGALSAFQAAVQETPDDEKLYVLVADQCMASGAYDLGMQVADVGLQHLPRSARLHYERAAFSTYENQVEQASSEYEMAARLAPGSDISYMAIAQDDLLQGKIQGAIQVAHKGIESGHGNYILLTIFGDAVARAGISPSEALFSEAEQALTKSIAERPRYAPSHLALGELLLDAGRMDDAISHLEQARALAPADPAVYSHLAIAYRRKGRADQEQQALATLSKLNQQQAQKYKTDSPDKAGYGASAPANHKPSQ